MPEISGLSLSTNGFMPHGHCFLWTPALLWGHVVSDLTIAGSYFSIPLALWYFTEKRTDLPYRWDWLSLNVPPPMNAGVSGMQQAGCKEPGS